MRPPAGTLGGVSADRVPFAAAANCATPRSTFRPVYARVPAALNTSVPGWLRSPGTLAGDFGVRVPSGPTENCAMKPEVRLLVMYRLSPSGLYVTPSPRVTVNVCAGA